MYARSGKLTGNDSLQNDFLESSLKNGISQDKLFPSIRQIPSLYIFMTIIFVYPIQKSMKVNDYTFSLCYQTLI
jgi:hypothetical protein